MTSGPRFTMVWNGPQVERLCRVSVAKGLTAASAVLADKMARNMGSEGGGVIGADVSPLAGGPTSGRKRVKGRARYKAAPPGAFPGVRTSNLRNSMAFRPATPERLAAAAGTNLARAPALGEDGKPVSANDVDRYALFLEFGTSRMAPRPFLARTLREEGPRLYRTFMAVATKEFEKGGNIAKGRGKR